MTQNGARRIALCGKGGSGKTTIAGTLARALARRGHRVVAVDGDSNPNLAISLGIPADRAGAITPLPRTLINRWIDEDGVHRTRLLESPEEIIRRFGVTAPDDVTLLLMGRVDHAGAGWMCATHATVRSLVGELVGAASGVTVADMEAGLEHLSRGTPRHMDTIVAIIEPYFKSLETGRKAYELAKELNIPRVHVVANKVRTSEDADAIDAFCGRHGLSLLTTIPYDKAFIDADRQGKSPIDVAPSSRGVGSIGRLAQLLEGDSGGS